MTKHGNVTIGVISESNEDGLYCTVRFEETLEVDIFKFLAIYCEPELCHKWIPNCYYSKELKHVSRNEKVSI